MRRATKLLIHLAEFNQFAPQFDDGVTGLQVSQAFSCIGVERLEAADFIGLCDQFLRLLVGASPQGRP